MVEGAPNSIVVTATAKTKGSPAGMKQSIWFGGSAEGISGGSRIFLTGDPSRPGRVVWSDQGRPLYFPENCYAVVGESDAPVTAMAKQEDMLVFFKNTETYFTKLIDGPAYTADDLLSGAILDVTAVDAAFPIYQIHPGIGCDLPNTVKLCDNRLIWASTTGHVYTLVSADIYSTANIYRLTDELGPIAAIRSYEEQKGGITFTVKPPAFAGVRDGWYYLLSGPHIYVTDYRSNAVRKVASYAKDRAPAAWYPWEYDHLGITLHAVLSSEKDGMLLIADSGGELFVGRFTDGDKDVRPHGEAPLWASFRTKLYDFARPEALKKVVRLSVKAGGNGTLDVAFLTERGETPVVRHKELYTEKGPREAGYLRDVKILPTAPRVQQFGFRADMRGRMAVGGLAFHYKYLR